MVGAIAVCNLDDSLIGNTQKKCSKLRVIEPPRSQEPIDCNTYSPITTTLVHSSTDYILDNINSFDTPHSNKAR